jgi:anti-sigma B factor antagonist
MSSFNIDRRNIEDLEVIELNGELDAHTAPQLEESIRELIDLQRFKIIVNCTHLEYISSAGLGVFMAYIEDVRSLGGDIKLTNLKPKVYNVFDLLGFPTLYDILEREEEAVTRFLNSN